MHNYVTPVPDSNTGRLYATPGRPGPKGRGGVGGYGEGHRAAVHQLGGLGSVLSSPLAAARFATDDQTFCASTFTAIYFTARYFD